MKPSIAVREFVNNNFTVGNEIRGRKIDSPHLLVVKEIADEENEDLDIYDDDYNGLL